jgi:ubiquinone/menaquinone biosynthesis C-methylase UbiE
MDKEYAKYLLSQTKRDYNLTASDFSRTRRFLWQELDYFKKFIIAGDKVIDIGCGNGRLASFFSKMNVEYIGIDNSDELIKEAKKNNPQNSFLEADALGLPFPDNNFNKAFMIAVLHNIPSKEFRLKALKEASRILKNNGLLILTVWRLPRKESIYIFLKYFFSKIIGRSKLDFKDIFKPWGGKVERYIHFFTKRELKNLAREAGFEVLELGFLRSDNKKRNNIYLVAKKK